MGIVGVDTKASFRVAVQGVRALVVAPARAAEITYNTSWLNRQGAA